MQQQCRPEDYELVFGNPTGQMVLEDLLHGFHFYDPMWKTEQSVEDLVFREGQRSVVLWIKNTVQSVQDGQKLYESYNVDEDTDAR